MSSTSDEISNYSSPPRAPQACVSCRKQKRKCDKAIPGCTLCNRMGRACDYSDNSPPPSSDDFAFLRQKVQELEQRLNERNSPGHGGLPSLSKLSSPVSSSGPMFAGKNFHGFPTVFFLDSEAFQCVRLPIPRPSITVSAEILGILGTASDIQGLVGTYFMTIHTWLPMISKKRLYQNLTNPKTEPGADLALLFLCVRLITQRPLGVESAQISLYWTTKQFYAIVESNALMSIQLLQAALLIAIYEAGHGIYPAAYLSVGHCARLGHAMGLHDRKNVPQMLRRPGTWTEQEEMRRVWWTVLLMDRYVNIGNRGHPLACEDPLRTDVLPCEDEMWDQGEMTPSEPIFVSSPTNLRAGAFARTCQASHLLGRVISHRNDRTIESPYRLSEAAQLHRTITALSSLLPAEFEVSPEKLSTPIALCYSAMLDLYDPYSCTESNRGEHTVEETEMQGIAIAGLKGCAELVLRFSEHFKRAMAYDLAATSPLMSDCLYQAAANYAWLIRESGSPEMVASLSSLTDALRLLDSRWKIAGEYIKILDATEFSITGND